MLSFKEISAYSKLYAVQREPLWKKHGKCRYHPASISDSNTNIEESWASLEKLELPISFRIPTMFQSLTGTGQAYRHYTVWTWVQTNHIHCLQTAPSASSELDQFNTSVHPCHLCLGIIYDTATATYPATCEVTDLHLCLNLGNLFQFTGWDHGHFLLAILRGIWDTTSLHFHVQATLFPNTDL